LSENIFEKIFADGDRKQPQISRTFHNALSVYDCTHLCHE